MPERRILYNSVVRFTPSRTAAPLGPPITQSAARKELRLQFQRSDIAPQKKVCAESLIASDIFLVCAVASTKGIPKSEPKFFVIGIEIYYPRLVVSATTSPVAAW